MNKIEKFNAKKSSHVIQVKENEPEIKEGKKEETDKNFTDEEIDIFEVVLDTIGDSKVIIFNP